MPDLVHTSGLHGVSRQRWIGAVLLVSLVVGACGSTVQRAGPSSGVTGGRSGEATAPAVSEGAEVGEGTTADGDRQVDSAEVGNPSTPASPGGAQTPNQPGKRTSSSLSIGIVTVKNVAAVNAVFGVNLQGDTKTAYQIAVDDLNARGGVLGRKVVPVYFDYDATGADASAQDQAACAAFTQDHHVFAAFMVGQHTPALLVCLERAGVVAMQAPGPVHQDAADFRRFPHFLTAGSLNLTRVGSAMVDGLAAQRYFTRGAKVGLLVHDTPSYQRAVDVGLRPALKRRGLDIAEEAKIPPTYTLGDTSNTAGPLQNAVLRFRAAGITHVLDLTWAYAQLFMRDAESQGYRPRYGLSSMDALNTATIVAPAEQLHGTLAVGWTPSQDVAKPPVSASGRRCDELMRAHGWDASAGPAYFQCDTVDIFARAAALGGSPLTTDSFVAGLYRLGKIQPGSTFGVRYAADRRDGVATVAHVRYDDGCKCFQYTSAPYDL